MATPNYGYEKRQKELAKKKKKEEKLKAKAERKSGNFPAEEDTAPSAAGTPAADSPATRHPA
ncbi:MAG: hypothetical protein ORN29_01075 [Rhodoferax sp.]|nr:hypothetical protein [Rhodoferax sp.]